MNKKNCKVSIFGEHYSLLTDENPDRVQAAAQRVDQLMKELHDKMEHADARRIAVLVALQAWNKILEMEETASCNDQQVKQLIETIDSYIIQQ